MNSLVASLWRAFLSPCDGALKGPGGNAAWPLVTDDIRQPIPGQRRKDRSKVQSFFHSPKMIKTASDSILFRS